MSSASSTFLFLKKKKTHQTITYSKRHTDVPQWPHMVLQQQKSNVAQKVSFALAAKAKEYQERERAIKLFPGLLQMQNTSLCIVYFYAMDLAYFQKVQEPPEKCDIRCDVRAEHIDCQKRGRGLVSEDAKDK